MRRRRLSALLAAAGLVAGCGGTVKPAATRARIVKIAVGTVSSTALGADGSLWYWGTGENAPGSLWSKSDDARRPTKVEGIGTVADVSWATARAHACIALRDGSVDCWGDPTGGALGHPASNDSTQTDLGPVPGLSDIVQVACDDEASCALSKSGQVYCWGDNTSGQIGIGVTSKEEDTPQPVHDATDIVQIAFGGGHACALRRGGAVICWGSNENGESGGSDIGIGSNEPSPVTVPLEGSVQQLACGQAASYAVMADHSVMAWGAGTATPHVSATLVDATFILAGFKAPTCVLHTDGSADCAGDNTWGVLGNGTTGGYDASLVRVHDLEHATQISTDFFHVCALDAAGAVWCWGDNRSGELGDGSTTASLTPTAVTW